VEKRKNGSVSFPRVGSRPAEWSDLHGALSKRFDLLAEPLAAPGLLLLRMQAQRINVVRAHAGEQATIGVKARDVICSQREVGCLQRDARLFSAVRAAGMEGSPRYDVGSEPDPIWNLMSVSMHTASVPVFQQMLTALAGVLAKAETHVAERKIEPAALLQSRLFPDMFPLSRQVQIACDFATSVSARLAGAEVPAYEIGDQTFADLQQRIAATLAFIGGLDAARFEGSGEREIVLRPGTPKERSIGGQAYLLAYGLPQFFFHLTTAYDLLRHNGVEIGKKDFMGAY
jgi:uncharacterized protein